MKELLESAFNQADQNCLICRDNMGILQTTSFEEWYEQNKSKIDDAVESYLESQGKSIVDTNRLEMLEDSFMNHSG